MTAITSLAAASLDASRAERVERAGTQAGHVDAGFGALVDTLSREASAGAAPSGPSTFQHSRSGELEPLARFESFVLGSFVETMLPKDEGFFGGGMAGNVWRSMMAERMGEEIARAGGIGIADLLRERSPAAPPPDDAKG